MGDCDDLPDGGIQCPRGEMLRAARIARIWNCQLHSRCLVDAFVEAITSSTLAHFTSARLLPFRRFLTCLLRSLELTSILIARSACRRRHGSVRAVYARRLALPRRCVPNRSFLKFRFTFFAALLAFSNFIDRESHFRCCVCLDARCWASSEPADDYAIMSTLLFARKLTVN